MTRPLVIKFGGELLDDPRALGGGRAMRVGICGRAARRLVIVHGGGKEIDAALEDRRHREAAGGRAAHHRRRRRLDVVVAVLAGADQHEAGRGAECGRRRRRRPDRRGRSVRLVEPAPAASDGGRAAGRSGSRRGAGGGVGSTRLLDDVAGRIGSSRSSRASASTAGGQLLNVNADTLAGHLAARLGARRLVIAGTTPGVLDAQGATLPVLESAAVAALVERRDGHGGDDRQAARLRARARGQRGRRGDRGRARSPGAALNAALPENGAPASGNTIGEDGYGMTTVAEDIVARETRHVLQTYKRNPVTLVRGQGVAGSTTRMAASISICCPASAWRRWAHAHPALVRAIADQAQTLIHTSNLFYHPLQGRAGRTAVAELSGLPRAFFCNSGTEAVEACLKFARRYWHTKASRGPSSSRSTNRFTAGRSARCR